MSILIKRLTLAGLFVVGLALVLYQRKVNVPKDLFAVIVTVIILIVLQVISLIIKVKIALSVISISGFASVAPVHALKIIGMNNELCTKMKKNLIWLH